VEWLCYLFFSFLLACVISISLSIFGKRLLRKKIVLGRCVNLIVFGYSFIPVGATSGSGFIVRFLPVYFHSNRLADFCLCATIQFNV